MPIPLMSKTYQEKLKLNKKYFTRDEDEENVVSVFDQEEGDHDFGRIMQFSSIGDSCRRDVSPGIEGFLAFNVTSKGWFLFLAPFYLLDNF